MFLLSGKFVMSNMRWSMKLQILPGLRSQTQSLYLCFALPIDCIVIWHPVGLCFANQISAMLTQIEGGVWNRNYCRGSLFQISAFSASSLQAVVGICLCETGSPVFCRFVKPFPSFVLFAQTENFGSSVFLLLPFSLSFPLQYVLHSWKFSYFYTPW